MRMFGVLKIAFSVCILMYFGLIANGNAQSNQAATDMNENLININGKFYEKCLNGFLDDNGSCIEFSKPTCPAGQLLVNGLCYNANQLPTQICKEGYYLANNWCYPLFPKECPFETTTTAAITTEFESEATTLAARVEQTSTTTTAMPTITTEFDPELTVEQNATTTTTMSTITTEFDPELRVEQNTTTTTTMSTITTEFSQNTTTMTAITTEFEPEVTTLTTTTTELQPEATTLPSTTTTELQPETTTATTTNAPNTTVKPNTITTTEQAPEVSTLPQQTTPTKTTQKRNPTATPPLSPQPLTRCPVGSVVVNNLWRKIICSRGEFYGGSCLEAACPEGTVWFNEQCQPPGYVTTIIHIENRIHNEKIYREPQFHVVNVNKVKLQTANETYESDNFHPTTAKTITTRTTTTATTITPHTTSKTATTVDDRGKCCTVVTPRLCKQYGPNWVCFNRRYKRCNSVVCTSDIIYLKPPAVAYESSVLIMPPNPPLRACEEPNCDEENTVDCSGCADGNRAKCSTHCYRYMCPKDTCSYMDLQEYCFIYRGEFGCSKTDGCVWSWCV